MSDLIAALDSALAAAGEDIILRRRIGQPPNQTFVSVTCRARIDGLDTAQSPAGIKLSELTVIMSPRQIDAAQWPGGTIPVPPPFNADPRIPRVNDTDDLVIRGQPPRVITHVDAKLIDGQLVRINLRCVA
jgi:hypothetical protein